MLREWEPEGLIACWTLVEGDSALVGNRSGATRLGLALRLKFFELEGRFPCGVGELPEPAVNYVAQQVPVHPAELGAYDWSGWTIEYHRAQIDQVQSLGNRQAGRRARAATGERMKGHQPSASARAGGRTPAP